MHSNNSSQFNETFLSPFSLVAFEADKKGRQRTQEEPIGATNWPVFII